MIETHQLILLFLTACQWSPTRLNYFTPPLPCPQTNLHLENRFDAAEAVKEKRAELLESSAREILRSEIMISCFSDCWTRMDLFFLRCFSYPISSSFLTKCRNWRKNNIGNHDARTPNARRNSLRNPTVGASLIVNKQWAEPRNRGWLFSPSRINTLTTFFSFFFPSAAWERWILCSIVTKFLKIKESRAKRKPPESAIPGITFDHKRRKWEVILDTSIYTDCTSLGFFCLFINLFAILFYNFCRSVSFQKWKQRARSSFEAKWYRLGHFEHESDALKALESKRNELDLPEFSRDFFFRVPAL